MPTKLFSSRNCLSCDSVHTRTVLSREAVMTPSGVVITPLTCASAQGVSRRSICTMCMETQCSSHIFLVPTKLRAQVKILSALHAFTMPVSQTPRGKSDAMRALCATSGCLQSGCSDDTSSIRMSLCVDTAVTLCVATEPASLPPNGERSGLCFVSGLCLNFGPGRQRRTWCSLLRDNVW